MLQEESKLVFSICIVSISQGSATGQDLYSIITDHLGIKETIYFGLMIIKGDYSYFTALINTVWAEPYKIKVSQNIRNIFPKFWRHSLQKSHNVPKICFYYSVSPGKFPKTPDSRKKSLDSQKKFAFSRNSPSSTVDTSRILLQLITKTPRKRTNVWFHFVGVLSSNKEESDVSFLSS